MKVFEPMNMYKFQKKMVKTFHKNRFTICKLPRQSGKSTIIIILSLIHYVLFNPNVNVDPYLQTNHLLQEIF